MGVSGNMSLILQKMKEFCVRGNNISLPNQGKEDTQSPGDGCRCAASLVETVKAELGRLYVNDSQDQVGRVCNDDRLDRLLRLVEGVSAQLAANSRAVAWVKTILYLTFFNGENIKLKVWMRQMDDALKQMSCDEREKVLFVLQHLEGPAVL